MVKYPGFSERIFEFAFNGEFAKRHKAMLAACPTLPTPQEEKSEPYDIEFKLIDGSGQKESLFLQHKVARLVTSKSGSNARFFKFAAGPYYAFVLDSDQYNLLRKFANRGRRIYYCAPLCTRRREIDRYFMEETICHHSVWLDVRHAGAISDLRSHNIVYSANGKRSARFSEEPHELVTRSPSEYQPFSERHARGLDRGEAAQLYSDVYQVLRDWRRHRIARTGDVDGEMTTVTGRTHAFPQRLGSDTSREEFITETARILAEWYGVTWLIVVT